MRYDALVEMRSPIGYFAAVLLAALPMPAMAQFIPRDIMIPGEVAAQRIAPDLSVPTADDLAQIGALEIRVRIDQSCNTAWDPALEAPRRTLLALYEKTYGPGHPATARPLLSLLCHYAYNTHTPADHAEREQIAARLIAIGRARTQPSALLAGLIARGGLRLEANQPAQAVADATEALAIARRQFAGFPALVATCAASLAADLEAAGRPSDAEPLRQEVVTLLQSESGGDRFVLAAAYEALGNNLISQLRTEDAKVWYARELDVYEAALPGADVNRLEGIVAYAQRLFWTDPARVEALYLSVLARQQADPASNDGRNWMTLWNLAKSARLRGDIDAAIAYQRRVIAAVGSGPDRGRDLELAQMLAQQTETAPEAEAIYRLALASDPDSPQLLEDLGNTLWMLGRFDEALPMRRRAVDIAVARFGPSHRETVRLTQNLGVALWIMHRPQEARPYYEAVLAGYRAELSAIPETGNAEYRRNLAGFVSKKASDLLRLYWTIHGSPGSRADDDAKAHGFAVAQLAHPSVSASAISENAARSLAARAGKAELFASWVAARDRVVALDEAIGAAAQRGASGDAERISLLAERAAAGTALEAATQALRQQLPVAFATLRPEPVTLAEVTGRRGTPGLLHADEALLLLYPGMPDVRGEMSRGIVFAVTREGSAWSEVPVDGADLADLVEDLHRQLADPRRSGVTVLYPGQPSDGFLRYDRAVAYRAYQALFANPAIAELLRGKQRWTIVPEGPLLALNFAALVAAPPPGGAAGDVDPEALRATRWLGLERVISVVPSVDALRIARSSPVRAIGGGSFYGIGDPAFKGVADPPGQPLPGRRRGAADAPAPGAGTGMMARQQFYRGGVADSAMLAQLPRLDYSAAEVEQMAALLHASPDRQVLQVKATQATLEKSNADGTLGNSAVVLFATHALVGGSSDGSLAEPALALTPGVGTLHGTPDANDDGLLTASEVAQLHFNSALVILSACDTAAGSTGGDGFSGLTRAFLLAGARSVLATYSPVVDEVGGQLTTAAVAQLPAKDGNIAAALQQAMRDVAADPSLDERGESLAHPAAWAVYVAVDPS